MQSDSPALHRGHDGAQWTFRGLDDPSLDTDIKTQTGGRVKRISQYIGREPFLLTYGDGVSKVNMHKIVEFHRSQGKIATVTAVRPPARFGDLTFDGEKVSAFAEKPQTGEGWINGGFFVLEPEIVNYIDNDDTSFESTPMARLTEENQLMA